jgi:hypothetical protein
MHLELMTLCCDLAELYKPYAANVLSTSKVINVGLRTQIDKVLAKPWRPLLNSVIVIYQHPSSS